MAKEYWGNIPQIFSAVGVSTERVLRNVLRRSKNPHVNSNSRGSYHMGIRVSLFTEAVPKNVISGSKNPPGTVERVRKLLAGHHRVAVHRNSPQKRTQRVAKPPGTLKFARKFPPGRYLLGVSLSTDIVLKNVRRGSKNPPGTVEIARKLSPGRVAIHPKRVFRNVLSGSTNPQVHSNSRENHLLGISVSPYTEIVLKNSGSKNPQLHSNLCCSIWFARKASPGCTHRPNFVCQKNLNYTYRGTLCTVFTSYQKTVLLLCMF